VFRIEIVAFDSFLQGQNNTFYKNVPYVRFYSPYLEVQLNNSETSYLNLPCVSE